MRQLYVTSLLVLLALSGCGTSWENTGGQGPWCAAGRRARVFSKTFSSFNGPRQTIWAYESKSGFKHDSGEFARELNEYFSKCTFINQWHKRGTIGSTNGTSTPNYESPFDLYLVSMNPTVVVGVDKRARIAAVDKKARSDNPTDSLSTPKVGFVWSTYVCGPIDVATVLQYHPGAKVVWLSPAVDNDLHQVDVTSGTASFPIGNNEQITLSVDDTKLVTARK
jgi:hypothetical protein